MIKLASDGDRTAFDMLVKHYNQKVIAIAKYYVHGDAEDVAQIVWMKIWSKFECIKYVDNFSAWLFQVTRFQCLDNIKSNTLKKKFISISLEENFELIDSLLCCDDTTEEVVLKSDALKVLKKYIYELKEIYSLPIALYYLEGFTLTETAQYMGLAVSTVKWRLHTGRQLIKKLLLKGGFINE